MRQWSFPNSAKLTGLALAAIEPPKLTDSVGKPNKKDLVKANKPG
jgi:hypothetical protein